MPFSRRRLLGLMVGAVGGAALRWPWPVHAQGGEVATPEEAFLSPSEIEEIRARRLEVGFNIGHRHDDYTNAVIRAAQTLAAEYNLNMTVRESGFSAIQQIADLRELLGKSANGVIFSPLDIALTGPLVSAFNAANIPVVTFGGKPRIGSFLTVIDSDDANAAYAACQALIAAAGGEGDIAILSTSIASNAIQEQERGAIKAISESKMRLLGVKPTKRLIEAFGVARNLIRDYPNLRAIFSLWGIAAQGAAEAVAELGAAVKLGGFNIDVADFRRFAAKDVRLAAFAGQRAAVQVRAGIGLLCKRALGQTVKPRLTVPTVLITAENYRDSWEVIFPGVPAPWPGVLPTPAK